MILTKDTVRRVSTRKSPQIKVFYDGNPLRITIDSGAEISMIKTSIATHIGAIIKKTTQSALQADGFTPLQTVGETHLELTRDGVSLHIEALVVNDLDVDVLAGMPFISSNDITIRPYKQYITLGYGLTIQYGPPPEDLSSINHVRRTQAHLLRNEASSTVVWPGSYLEISLPKEIHPESTLIVEPRYDTKQPSNWPKPDVIEAIGGKVRIPNDSTEPQFVRKNDHVCQVHLISETSNALPTYSKMPSIKSLVSPQLDNNSCYYSDTVKLDSDNILPIHAKQEFKDLLQKYDSVFNPTYKGYNGAMGDFQCHINMGPVQPPQRKGRLPQYSRDKLVDLQQKCDDLEALGVLRKPEELNITAEYLNPSFLVKKPNGGFRLVTAFEDVGRYSKPQLSLMPDVDSTLRSIGQWKYIIVSDLTSAFHQIPLSKQSLKYCGIVTPFKGVRVYTKCAMGMPGSETALEELMCRVLGDCLHDGIVTKLADDLYCGANTPEELLQNWERVLSALHKSGLCLSASKTIICPRSTTIFGWAWSDGKI